MLNAKWKQIRLQVDYCGRASCSGRQMRNGFFTLNLIAWVLIALAANLLA